MDARKSGPLKRRLFLVGKKLYLRPLESHDLKGSYLDWLNDYAVTRYLEVGIFPTTKEALAQYLEAVAKHPMNVMLAIVDRATDRHIGNIKLGPVNLIHRHAELGILIGEKAFWGRGYAREAIDLVLDYGFSRLNLHKIQLGVHADHAEAIQLYERLGFTREGLLRQHLFRDGTYRDKALYGLLREEHLAQQGRSARAGAVQTVGR